MNPLSSAPSDRAALLERLNRVAAVSVDSANDYSLRSWLTSAKRCLDQVFSSHLSTPCYLIPQAEEDLREKDLEAAYVNFLKAISIVVEVFPQHRDVKAIESQKSLEADGYWVVRNVHALSAPCSANLYCSVSLLPSKPSRKSSRNSVRLQYPPSPLLLVSSRL